MISIYTYGDTVHGYDDKKLPSKNANGVQGDRIICFPFCPFSVSAAKYFIVCPSRALWVKYVWEPFQRQKMAIVIVI